MPLLTTVKIQVYVNKLELVSWMNPLEVFKDVVIHTGSDFEIMDGIEYLRNVADNEPELRFTKTHNSQAIIDQWQVENS